MKKFRFLPFLLALSLLCLAAFGSAYAVETPTVAAKAAILAERNTGDVLFEYNADAQLPIASTTKIMTAMLAIEACERGDISLDDMVTVSATSQFDLVEDGSSQGIVPGEVISVKDLLYCALVASANEACNILAEHVSGDVSTFLTLMNTRALELGCSNTHFSNTHGLPDDTHYSSARDLYLIARHAMTLETFASICRTPSYTVPATNITGSRSFNSTNKLLTDESGLYGYEYANGIKTGSTSAAGLCLVSSATKDDVDLICVVLGAEAALQEDGSYLSENFTESRKLFQWGFDNFSWQEILTTSDLVTEVPVYLGSGADTVVLRPAESVSAYLPNDFDASLLQQKVTLYNDDGSENFSVTAPVAAGDELGEMTLEYGDYSSGPIKLVANRGIELSKLRYMSVQIKQTLGKPVVKLIIVLIALLVVAYIVFVILYNRRRKQRREAMRMAAAARAQQMGYPQPPVRQERRRSVPRYEEAPPEQQVDDPNQYFQPGQEPYPDDPGQYRDQEEDYFK